MHTRQGNRIQHAFAPGFSLVTTQCRGCLTVMDAFTSHSTHADRKLSLTKWVEINLNGSFPIAEHVYTNQLLLSNPLSRKPTG